MKSFFIILLLSFFVLTACNLPATVVTATPEVDRLSTAVSRTLTARPILPSPVSPANKPSETSIPKIISSPTFTETFTPVSSLTFTETATPDVYKNTLGTPAWQNHLDNGKSFGIGAAGYQDDSTHITIDNGVMNLSSISTVGFRSWRLASPMPKDFYLEEVFRTVSCGAADQYGVVYRAPDYSSGLGYYFGITCSGNYALYRWSSSGQAVILSGSSTLIKPGNNQVNTIGINARGNNFTFYMNDKVIQTFTDTSLPDPGHFGVFVGAYSGNLSVQLDDITYWELH